MKSSAKLALKASAAVLGCAAISPVLMLAYLTRDIRHACAVSKTFKPGTTVAQIFSSFPTDFSTVSISVPLRTNVCKTSSGELQPPEEYPVDFPEIKEDDPEGRQLSNEVEYPLQFSRFQRLNEHLRERREWAEIVQLWTVFIQDDNGSNHAALYRSQVAQAYCRRGAAYLAQDQVSPGFADLRKGCKLGAYECCAVLNSIPPVQLSMLRDAERRIKDKAKPCEPSVHSYSLSGPIMGNSFQLTTYVPDNVRAPITRSVSRDELSATMSREFTGREWLLAFTYTTSTPAKVSFSVIIGRDGRIHEVYPARIWD
jgi:hypothetical protein